MKVQGVQELDVAAQEEEKDSAKAERLYSKFGSWEWQMMRCGTRRMVASGNVV